MELDEHETPQKLKTHKFIINYQTNNSQRQMSISPCQLKVTPKNNKCLRKSINPRTPKAQSLSYSVAACSSLVSSNSNSVHSISMALVQTPPAKRYQRVKNPFEAALTDRLHLPLIASPSLFQRPNTPQLSSTQFEWTIDEVSSLKPAHVEPHETQFHDSPNPELEAKAQSAISSYFKEQQIVPSPIDCPLRSNRIVLSEINGTTPLSKPGRRIRDCASQTELTLPPILPPALEEALKPYFQPQLAGKDKVLKNLGASRSWISNSSEVKDTSLRRKLFDMHNIVVLENENQQTPRQQQLPKPSISSAHSNSSPISLNSLQHTAIVGKLSDSLDKSSFGSLSPISAADSLSPNCLGGSATKRKSRFGNFLSELEEVELLSPIHPPVRRKPLTESNRSQYRSHISEISKIDLTTNNVSTEAEENELFTPERSSSPLHVMAYDNLAEFSTDSFNIKVSRLKVNSSKQQATNQDKICKILQKSAQLATDVDIFPHDDTEDLLENTVDMDDMQVSQLSGHSSNCSSSQSDTPRGKRRSASRKNLSQSFSANWLQDEDEQELDTSQSMKIKEILAKKQFSVTSATTSCSFGGISKQRIENTTPKKSLTFYRTDSGFNEMSHSSMSSCEALKSGQDKNPQLDMLPLQEILVCCSTPSTKDKFNFMD
ncbi:protein aurora borealis [Calliphora vicina]|uniref:protein aurora borealis n=1 Tax=Calliphora vicina TaxID=7373 RepID=UPI00325BEA22